MMVYTGISSYRSRLASAREDAICKLRVMNFVCVRVEIHCGLAGMFGDHRASSRLSFRRSN
jgi:hypothetical protein